MDYTIHWQSCTPNLPISFLLTQLIEITVGALIWKNYSMNKAYRYIFLASCLTHPNVWFVMPIFTDRFGCSYSLILFFSELYAYGFECLNCRYLEAENTNSSFLHCEHSEFSDRIFDLFSWLISLDFLLATCNTETLVEHFWVVQLRNHTVSNIGSYDCCWKRLFVD